MLANKALSSAPSAEPVFVESVFSTYLYTGNGATRTITNGIDLSGKGGLVWVKVRGTEIRDHALADTQRGTSQILRSSSSSASQNQTFSINAFNSNGFSVGGGGDVNFTNNNICSWTFRKQAKFFDVVTYTGNGSNRTISHNLGSVPGCIIVKRTDTTADWQVYHRSLANTEYMVLNSTAAKATGTTRWNSTTPTSTVFSLGTDTTVNASGGTYVAYLFAHNAGGFGLTGTDNVISCGSFTTDGSGNATVSLGYEPQWVMFKRSDSTGSWLMFDNMRGMTVNTSNGDQTLFANLTDAESSVDWIDPTSTGFNPKNIATSATYIYIAIRRGPMKVPTSGTSVFAPLTVSGDNSSNRYISGVGYPPDALFYKSRGSGSWNVIDRLRGAPLILYSNATVAESSADGSWTSFNQDGVTTNSPTFVNSSGVNYIAEFFRRAPGFFDVVCDTGTGSAHTITHNLSAVPELMIRKKRSAADAWIVYANNDNTDYLVLNTTAATVDDNTMWNDTSPTSSVFTVGTNDDVNGSGATFVTYLFASVSGVSKVGSYTGSGTTKQIDCGFTGGARFVLIKRTDSTGDWYVWDTARGIVSGNDPYLLLNSSATEVTNTDYIDTYSAGFEISSTAPAAINANGGTYIFLAVS